MNAQNFTQKTIETIKKYGDQKSVLVLVGNKSDLSERIITKEESKRLAEEHSIPSFETTFHP